MTKSIFDNLTLGTGLSVCDDSSHVAWYSDEEGDVVGIGHGNSAEEAIHEARLDAQATMSLEQPPEFTQLVADLNRVTAEMAEWRKRAESVLKS